MDRSKHTIDFYNVPKTHKYINTPDDLLCEACNDVIEHPVQVFTCTHRLCTPCWQKSAYNLWGAKNECLKCKKPTDLVCYRDYWRFVGRNIFEQNLMLDHTICAKLHSMDMYCNVEGCNYKGKRWEVLIHEKKCWRERRNSQLEAERQGEGITDTNRNSKTPETQPRATTADDSPTRKQMRRK